MWMIGIIGTCQVIFTFWFVLVLVKLYGFQLSYMTESMFQEMLPFIPYIIAVKAGLMAMSGGLVIWEGFEFLLWIYVNKKFKDDRWKKRRKRALEKVSRLGNRLVITPITQGA